MGRFIVLLAASGLAGVVGATAVTCGIGLISGTGTWCGLPLYWVFGGPLALVSAVILGLPAFLLFRRLGLKAWWQYAIGGLFLATPLWYGLAQPFSSARWQASGFFDSLNYLGSGLVGGLVFWWLAVARERRADAL